MSNGTFDVFLERAAAPDREETLERRRLQGVFNARATLDKKNYFNERAGEA